MLFLGGKESSTLKEISETLGKETIDLYNTSDTRGQSRSYGLNYQKTGKELMSRDELAVMDGNKFFWRLLLKYQTITEQDVTVTRQIGRNPYGSTEPCIMRKSAEHTGSSTLFSFYRCSKCRYFSLVASPPRICRSDLFVSSTLRVCAASAGLI